MIKKILVFFLLCTTFCDYNIAQSLDTLKFKPYSTQKLSSYIAPAVFITYGVISLSGDNFIRKLDYTTNNELTEDFPPF
ncbi:hypothetical protein [Pedobacter alpinus]|uniref:DUF5683 domain-containing protein n=1 Tax=Pedobacter alpinus TaxID=1590643 RepID=A0ABW5TQJ0_9SPHI